MILRIKWGKFTKNVSKVVQRTSFRGKYECDMLCCDRSSTTRAKVPYEYE